MVELHEIGLDVVRCLINTLLCQQVSGQAGSRVETDDKGLPLLLLIIDVVERTSCFG